MDDDSATIEKIATLEEQVRQLFRTTGDHEKRLRLGEAREARILAWAATGAALGGFLVSLIT